MILILRRQKAEASQGWVLVGMGVPQTHRNLEREIGLGTQMTWCVFDIMEMLLDNLSNIRNKDHLALRKSSSGDTFS